MKPYLHLVTFKKVAGHTGVLGNELADKLAKQALRFIINYLIKIRGGIKI